MSGTDYMSVNVVGLWYVRTIELACSSLRINPHCYNAVPGKSGNSAWDWENSEGWSLFFMSVFQQLKLTFFE